VAAVRPWITSLLERFPGVEAWRRRRERLIGRTQLEAVEQATYDPFALPDGGPEIRLYFEVRGPDGRFMREAVDWQGYAFRHMPLRSREDWRDWHIAQELVTFRTLMARLEKARRDWIARRRRA
jgi:hypothetical protein